MIKEIINEFRKSNGRHPLAMDNWQENEYCLWHCKYMAEIDDCIHTPHYFRQGKAEAVARASFYRDVREALEDIIFKDFAESMCHRNVILFNDNLAGAFHVTEHNLIYACLRGW